MPGKSNISALALFVAAAAISVSQCSTPTAPTTPVAPLQPVASAIGRVLSGSSRVPVAGATLRWDSIGSSRLIGSTSVTTDASGLYAVWLPVADRHSVTINGNDAGVVLIGSVQQPIDFLINADSCPMIYGSVLDSVTLRPVAGATVGWMGQHPTTDATGQYQIGIPCGTDFGFGTTAFSITHPGYQFFFTPYGRAESLGRFPGSRREDRVMTPAQ